MEPAQRRDRKFFWSALVPGSDEMIASSGISFHIWRLYQHAWLVCLLFPILSLIEQPPELVHLISASLALVLFAAIYTWLMWPHPVSAVARPRLSLPLSWCLISILTIFVILLSLMYGEVWLWLLVGVSAIAGMLLPTLPALSGVIAVMGLTLLTIFVGIGLAGGWDRVDWLHLVPLALLVRGLGIDIIGIARLATTIRVLRTAQEERARLAVAEERLRLARDLHDVLGHTLSLITLKSELARRLVRHDPERTIQEISEIEQVARETLREVREAVAGYRQPDLMGELDAARQILEAAGITCQIVQQARIMEPSIDAVLAWTIREGVTNVIRHSRASWCQIQITCEDEMACVEICNDGYQASKHTPRGTGIAGLTERLSVYGGHIEIGPIENSCFHLQVKVPQSEIRRKLEA